jgi:sulfur carrier protein ThiS
MSITIKFGLGNEVVQPEEKFATVGDVLRDAAIQSLLGFGSNVEVTVNGSVVPNDTRTYSGMVLSIQTKAHTKGAADSFTVKFGLGNEVTQPVSKFATVGDVIRDAAIQSLLGFGSNVEATVNGSVVSNDTLIYAGMVVSLQTKAHTKGN